MRQPTEQLAMALAVNRFKRAAGQRSKLGLPAAAWLRQTSEIRELLLSTDAFQKEAILF